MMSGITGGDGHSEFDLGLAARAHVRLVDDTAFGRLLPLFDDRDHQLADPYLDAITALNGEELQKVAVELDGAVIALAAVRVRRLPMLGGIALVAGGPVVARSGNDGLAQHQLIASHAIATAYNEQGIRLHFRSPVLPTVEGWMDEPIPGLAPSPVFDPYHTMVLDLSADQEERRRQISSQWRRHLRESERADLTVDYPSVDETWRRMHPLYDEMQDRKHFAPAFPPEFWGDVFETPQASENFRGVVVHKRGRDLAAAIIGGNGAVATYLLGATAHVALPVRAGYLAMWATVGLAKKLGHRFFDLGGVDKAANPGGWQFKHGLRGEELSTPQPTVATPPGPRGKAVEIAELSAIKVRKRRR